MSHHRCHDRHPIFMMIYVLLITCLIATLPLSAVPRQIVQQIIAQIDNTRLDNYVKELSGVVPVSINGTVYTISTRCTGFPGNALTQEYLKMKLAEFGLTAQEQAIGSTGTKNIFAEILGTQYPQQRYIICAHFDDRPYADPAPGADDNASGVAATLEAARILTGYSLPYTVVFGFWNYEEGGLFGSQAYAAMAKSRGDQILAVINIDMIGWDGNGDRRYNAFTNGEAASTAICMRLNQVATDYQLNVNQLLVTDARACSDHYSFWQQGYPAMLLIEDYYLRADFNPYYHTAQDRFSVMHLDYFHTMSKLAIATLADYVTDVPMYQYAQVWPGDADYNGMVTEADLEKISAYWGETGPARVDATVQWIGQTAALWSTAAACFADADGNGFINEKDVLPIGLNWGKNHGLFNQQFLPLRKDQRAIPVLFPHPENPGGIPLDAGAEWTLLIDAGDAIDPVQNLFGCAFVLDYSLCADKIEAVAESATDLLGTDLVFFARPDNAAGQLALAVSMKSGQTPFSGYGVLIQVTFRNKTQLSGYNDIHLATQNAYANDDLGNPVPIRGTGYALSVDLASFEAHMENRNVVLTWKTLREEGVYGFIIERRRESEAAWRNIDWVPAVGAAHQYEYKDAVDFSGFYDYRLKMLDLNGDYTYSHDISIIVTIPMELVLYQNYPNPFNPTTTISFTLTEADFATLKIHDVWGRNVRTLLATHCSSGFHQLEWDGRDDSGQMAPAGVYFYILESRGQRVMKRMTLVK